MPVAEVTDAARTVIGPDDPAAVVRVVIIGRPIVPIEEVPVKMMMPEGEAAVAKATAVENMTAAKAAAMESATSETAAVKGRTSVKTATVKAAAMETATAAVETTATMATAAAMTATTANFSGQIVRGNPGCRR
jgi:hypothetical protein